MEDSRRARKRAVAAARGVGRAQFRALLRDGRHEALPSARTRKHFEAATDPCRRIQPEPDPAQTAGCGHATGTEKPCWASVFPTFVLSAVPGEGRFADPDALSRGWPAKGTIVPLPHTGSPPAILELFYHGLLCRLHPRRPTPPTSETLAGACGSGWSLRTQGRDGQILS